MLNIGGGQQCVELAARNGHRCIVDSEELSTWMLRVLRPYLPEVLQGGALIDLNERSRILCYTPGPELQSIHHIDVHVCMYVEDMWIKNVRYMDINVDEI